MSIDDTLRSWSEEVAELGVDMLADHGLINKHDFDHATAMLLKKFWSA